MVVLACRTCCVAIMLTCLVRSAAGQISDAPADVAGTYSALAEEGGSEDLPEDSGRVAEVADAGDGQTANSALPANPSQLPRLEQRANRFQWKPAVAQYGLEISIQHAWRFVHENGTIDATAYGPWFHDWIGSIGETRGWDDADGWHASYVGHPLNGGIYGFIEQQNDPLYRQVEWVTAAFTG